MPRLPPFEFLGHELGEAGEGALSHFGTRDADDDGIVRPDHDPGVDLGRAVGGAHHGRSTEGNIETERETGADRGGADHEGAAVQCGHMVHGCPLTRWRRRE